MSDDNNARFTPADFERTLRALYTAAGLTIHTVVIDPNTRTAHLVLDLAGAPTLLSVPVPPEVELTTTLPS